MSDFDLSLDGMADLQETLSDLEDDWSDAAEFIVESNASYSIQIEFGRGPIEADSADALRFENEDGEIIYRTSVDGHPPYPFFRPAIREFEANPEAFILKNTELNSLDGIGSADEAVRTVALSLESQIKTNATANAPGRSPGTHPEHPTVATGNLRARVTARRIG